MAKHSITLANPPDPLAPFVTAKTANAMDRFTVGRVQRVPTSAGIKWRLEELKTRDRFVWTNPDAQPVTLVLRTDVTAQLMFGSVWDAFPQVSVGQREERFTLAPGQTMNLDRVREIPEPWRLHACDIWLDAQNWHNYPNLAELLTGSGPVRVHGVATCPDAAHTHRFEATGPIKPQVFSGYFPGIWARWTIEVLP